MRGEAMGNGYIVRFVRRDGKPDEEYFYRTAEEARRHFDMFTDDDSGLYDRIEVEAQGETEKVLLSLHF